MTKLKYGTPSIATRGNHDIMCLDNYLRLLVHQLADGLFKHYLFYKS
ncbi:MAG: hypothetical protein ACOCW8_00230 [bacterium]